MIEDYQAVAGFDSVSGGCTFAVDAVNNLRATNCLDVDTDGSNVNAVFRKLLSMPLDITALMNRGGTLKFWHRHAGYAASNITAVDFLIIYDAGADGVTLNKYDYWRSTTLSNGAWNLGSGPLSTPTGSVGSPDDDDRRRAVAIGNRVVTTGPTAVTAILFGAAVLDGGASFIDVGGTPLIVPRLSVWNSNWDDIGRFKETASRAESTYRSSRPRLQFGYKDPGQLIHADGLRECLRRFDRYIQAASDWGISLEGPELVDTTTDAASGSGQTDPRKLNLTSTAEIEFLITTMGKTNVEVFIGPNALGQVEHGVIPSSSYVSSGSHVILENAMQFSHASGVRVRSRDYWPNLTLLGPKSIFNEDNDTWTLDAVVTTPQD